MKTLKINLVSILSVILAIGLMSFKLSENGKLMNKWYAVESGGTINPSAPLDAPSEAGEDCLVTAPTNVCAVELPDDHTFTNISQINLSQVTSASRP